MSIPAPFKLSYTEDTTVLSIALFKLVNWNLPVVTFLSGRDETRNFLFMLSGDKRSPIFSPSLVQTA